MSRRPLLAAALVALAACAREPAAPAPPPVAADTLGAFLPADVILDGAAGLAGPDPEAAARAYFAAGGQSEAREVRVETLERTDARAVVLVTRLGLMDDSVRDERLRLVYTRGEDGVWTPVEAGGQIRCQPARGHQEWGPAPCV